MLVLYGLISYGIICPPAMPIILSLWTNTLLFIFMTSLLFAFWSIIVCYMKTRVCLKWTLWEKIGSPLLTFEIEPTRYWKSWGEKWNEDDQTNDNEPGTIDGWNETPAWDQVANFDDNHLNLEEPTAEGWNAEEWEQLQQNPTWLETGMAVPNFIIMALANLDHFREEAPAWLSLYVLPITPSSEPEETAPPVTENPLENESKPVNPLPDNKPIPSFQFNWPPDNIGHMESDS